MATFRAGEQVSGSASFLHDFHYPSTAWAVFNFAHVTLILAFGTAFGVGEQFESFWWDRRLADLAKAGLWPFLTEFFPFSQADLLSFAIRAGELVYARFEQFIDQVHSRLDHTS